MPMLEITRKLAMAYITNRSAIYHGHKGKHVIMLCFHGKIIIYLGVCVSIFKDLYPYVTNFLEAKKYKISNYKVTRSTNGMYEAKQ